ncbi:hypothetical protein AAY473_009415 [Plecturocebus cupreus]
MISQSFKQPRGLQRVPQSSQWPQEGCPLGNLTTEEGTSIVPLFREDEDKPGRACKAEGVGTKSSVPQPGVTLIQIKTILAVLVLFINGTIQHIFLSVNSLFKILGWAQYLMPIILALWEAEQISKSQFYSWDSGSHQQSQHFGRPRRANHQVPSSGLRNASIVEIDLNLFELKRDFLGRIWLPCECGM